MLIILSLFIVLIIGLIIFFNIPYSKTKSEFNGIISGQINKAKLENNVFTDNDIKDLPVPVKKYFEYCGYLGTSKMSYMKAEFKNVDFIMSTDKPSLKINYTQYNFVNNPVRVAYIDSSLYGIPFEGLDLHSEGTGSMKGVIGKIITLFNEKSPAMDKAGLVTYLSECLIAPNAALQEYITWKVIDDLHAGAKIIFGDISVGGIFTFNEKGEMVSFTTDDREATATDGTSQQMPWSAICSTYKEVDGIKYPTKFKAVWHYHDGDIVYFNSNNIEVKYDYQQR